MIAFVSIPSAQGSMHLVLDLSHIEVCNFRQLVKGIHYLATSGLSKNFHYMFSL